MHRTLSRWLLIAGLAYVLALFGMGKILQPLLWIGWIPVFFEGLMGLSRDAWLTFFGGMEILLAVALLIPKTKVQRVASLLVALYLLGVISQTGLFNVIGVRDTGLFFMALALIFTL